eukprot:TRINITY_DN2544_c0_g1_i3.p7 TRINITY_DN2544_c0_g1~~TRINITY_DN2544_c0_g1_i3.p7  ORF type:complete len:117 (-),score=7.41 TRINITY_DN2544_c0_g1_i3:31-381(-)
MLFQLYFVDMVRYLFYAFIMLFLQKLSILQFGVRDIQNFMLFQFGHHEYKGVFLELLLCIIYVTYLYVQFWINVQGCWKIRLYVQQKKFDKSWMFENYKNLLQPPVYAFSAAVAEE